MNHETRYKIPLKIQNTHTYISEKKNKDQLTQDEKGIEEKLNRFYEKIPQEIKDFGELPYYPTHDDIKGLEYLTELYVTTKIACDKFWKEGNKRQTSFNIKKRFCSHLKKGIEILEYMIRY